MTYIKWLQSVFAELKLNVSDVHDDDLESCAEFVLGDAAFDSYGEGHSPEVFAAEFEDLMSDPRENVEFDANDPDRWRKAMQQQIYEYGIEN